MRRKFPEVNKTRKGVPKAYLKGAKNPAAREREILKTRKKYLSGKMTKADYEAVEKSRAKDAKAKTKKGRKRTSVRKKVRKK
jgi:hypothetical protein|tara:strand:- start:504 stop:749 length:246 start_codon:yes stop_codon:yes gene_type:complete